MITIRAGHPVEIEKIAEIMHYFPSGGCRAVVMTKDDEVIGAVLYDHWAYNSVNVHIYSKNPLTLSREFLFEIFNYPFVTCGRDLLIAITPEDSKGSLLFSKALGFRETYRFKEGWKPGIDLIVKEMRREECRYLQQKAA